VCLFFFATEGCVPYMNSVAFEGCFLGLGWCCGWCRRSWCMELCGVGVGWGALFKALHVQLIAMRGCIYACYCSCFFFFALLRDVFI